MGNHRTTNTQEKTQIPVSRSKTHTRPCSTDRNIIRTENRHRLGRFAQRNGLRLGNDLLAKVARLATGWCLGQNTPCSAEQIKTGEPDKLFPCGGGFILSTCHFWGAKTGPNPTDRRKKGSKHHMVTDANGIPLSIRLTGANRHDITQLLPLVDSIPPIAGKVGRPIKRPNCLLGDRAYDSQPHRIQLRRRGIRHFLAQRRTENGSGLGIYRWVVERSLSWLHQNRRLRVRYEKRDDIHQAFMTIGCVKICWNHLLNYSFC